MKHDELHAIAHNFAASLSSGLGNVVGFFATDVYANASSNDDCAVTIDFLNGTVSGQTVDETLIHAVPVYRHVFPNFCSKHGAKVQNFRRFEVRFTIVDLKRGFAVTIEDERGKSSTREYEAYSDKRLCR